MPPPDFCPACENPLSSPTHGGACLVAWWSHGVLESVAMMATAGRTSSAERLRALLAHAGHGEPEIGELEFLNGVHGGLPWVDEQRCYIAAGRAWAAGHISRARRGPMRLTADGVDRREELMNGAVAPPEPRIGAAAYAFLNVLPMRSNEVVRRGFATAHAECLRHGWILPRSQLGMVHISARGSAVVIAHRVAHGEETPVPPPARPFHPVNPANLPVVSVPGDAAYEAMPDAVNLPVQVPNRINLTENQRFYLRQLAVGESPRMPDVRTARSLVHMGLIAARPTPSGYALTAAGVRYASRMRPRPAPWNPSLARE